ncbi:MAG: helix-turn-helix domain-containing protein [Planctomycetota bacterium]
MSYEWVQAVLDRSQSTGGGRLVLLVIAEYANKQTGVAWPSADTIGKRAKLGLRQTRYWIAELVRLGELVIEQSGGGVRPGPLKDGERRGVSNVYRISLPTVQPSAPLNDAADRTVKPTNGAVQRSQTVQSTAANGAAACTRTRREPEENQQRHALSTPAAADSEGEVLKALREAGIQAPTDRALLREIPGLTVAVVRELTADPDAGPGLRVVRIREGAPALIEKARQSARLAAAQANTERLERQRAADRLADALDEIRRQIPAREAGQIVAGLDGRRPELEGLVLTALDRAAPGAVAEWRRAVGDDDPGLLAAIALEAAAQDRADRERLRREREIERQARQRDDPVWRRSHLRTAAEKRRDYAALAAQGADK